MIIQTISGKDYQILWDGVAFDGVLRFAVMNGDIVDIFSTFSKTEETGTLKRLYDGTETVYSGFTEFLGAMKDKLGNIVVSLAKGGVA